MNKIHLLKLVEKSLLDKESEDFEIDVDLEFNEKIAYSYWISDDGEKYLGKIVLEAVFNFSKSFNELESLKENDCFGVCYTAKFIPPDEDATNYASQINSKDFIKFLKLFKQRMDNEFKMYEEMSNEDSAPFLERISDKYELDFFPKKRIILFEKTNEDYMIKEKLKGGFFED